MRLVSKKRSKNRNMLKAVANSKREREIREEEKKYAELRRNVTYVRKNPTPSTEPKSEVERFLMSSIYGEQLNSALVRTLFGMKR